MASRAIVTQQARGEAGIGVGVHNQQTKKDSAAAGDGKNRRALGDIRNVVTVRGVPAAVDGKQIQRPCTRSFCAQLLANARAVAVDGNNKKNVCVNVEKAPPVAPKAVQKIQTAKVEPVEVIDISLDGKKKQIHGIANKPKEKVVNIDEANG